MPSKSKAIIQRKPWKNFWGFQRWNKTRATGAFELRDRPVLEDLLTLGRGFKALKQAIKLEYKLGRYDAVSLRYYLM